MRHLNIGPVYGVGQVEIEHSSKTSLFQETKEEIYRESGIFRPLVVLCFSELPGASPLDPLGLTALPDPPAELSNRYITKMRIGGQRTAFEMHHCTKCKDL